MKVSSTPGCTQLINFFLINEKIVFVDLPGYGFAKVPLRIKKNWGNMIESYLIKRKNLQAVFWLLDIRRKPSERDRQFCSWLQYHQKTFFIIATKSDKLSKNKGSLQIGYISEELGLERERIFPFSKLHSEGKKEILKEIEMLIDKCYN